jgi:hypothetical protein
MCAPREVVIQQTWRVESDGSYIVLVQSVEHPTVPPEASPHVRAEVSPWPSLLLLIHERLGHAIAYCCVLLGTA